MTEPSGTRGGLTYLATITSSRVLFTVSARVRTYFANPPPEGGFILATNHVSHFDPPLLSMTYPRPIDWIAVKELFHGKLLTSYFNALNVIPVDRQNADRNALRHAVKRLNAGRVVGIFPEGGIRDGEASVVNGAPMKGGVAMLAALSKAPVVPGLILGSDRLYNKRRWRPWSKAPVWMAFGAPILPPPDLRGEAARTQIEKELAAAFINLREYLMVNFSVQKEDLPRPPRQRMAES